jgi:hypothetical protein
VPTSEQLISGERAETALAYDPRGCLGSTRMDLGGPVSARDSDRVRWTASGPGSAGAPALGGTASFGPHEPGWYEWRRICSAVLCVSRWNADSDDMNLKCAGAGR